MIVPYYNCLILGFSNHKLEIDSDGEELIAQYLIEYFSEINNKESVVFQIETIDANAKQHLKKQISQIIAKVFSQLQVKIYKINNQFTRCKELYLWHKALQQLTFIQSANSKIPAKVDGIVSLKQYYQQYKTEAEMKQFLKSLLIQKIDHQKRTIKYRTPTDIEIFIHHILNQRRGEISVCQQTNKLADGNVINFVLIDQTQKYTHRLDILIKQIQKCKHINKQINYKITNNYTQNYLSKIAQSQISKHLNKYAECCITQNRKNILQLALFLKQVASLKVVLRYGYKLFEQQTLLKQQFIAFVAQMNVKYTAQVLKYITGFKEQINYSRNNQKYQKQKRLTYKINMYFRAFAAGNTFQQNKSNWRNNKCCKIQQQIRVYLKKRHMRKQLLQTYLQQKQRNYEINSSLYRQIIEICNSYQIKKLTKFNKHKYGFACCLQILDISSESNYFQFRPNCLFKLIQNFNKHQELLTKIICYEDCVQFTNIQGKIFQLGEKINNCDTLQKQNITPNAKMNGSNYSSIKSQIQQLYSSRSNQPSTYDSKISLRSSNYRDICHLFNKENSNKQTIFQSDGYHIKLDNSEKLFGRGCNHFGQLGLSNQPFIQDYICILPNQKIKLFSTMNNHTIAITTNNRIFHFGKQKGRFPQSYHPKQIIMNDKIMIIDIVCSYNDCFLLTNLNKVYSLQQMKYIRMPKQLQMQFDSFHLVRSGSLNLQIVYIIGDWNNCIDTIKVQQIKKYLIKMNQKRQNANSQSMLIDHDQQCRDIGQLSAIIEEQSY